MLIGTKMDLLNKSIVQNLPKGTVFGVGQQQKIKRFVKFVMNCYIPWWLTAPLPSAAPLNDLRFINNLIEYRKIDKPCADAALKAFSLHLWYLTEELTPLALFCNQVPCDTKLKMVEKLLTLPKDTLCSKRFGSGYGKPQFPTLPQDTVENLDLSIFIGVDSWSLFTILEIDPGFLDMHPEKWNSDPQYIKAKAVVDSLSVVNDGAERGVKLAHDFLHTARKESNLQNILQVVENDRASLPNQRKRKVEPKSWFLKF